MAHTPHISEPPNTFPPGPAPAGTLTLPTSGYADVVASASRRPKEGPTGTAPLNVAHTLMYSWDYACKRPDLRVLYEKSKDLLWNSRPALAWETPVDPT